MPESPKDQAFVSVATFDAWILLPLTTRSLV